MMNQRDGHSLNSLTASWAVKANKQKFWLVGPAHQMTPLSVTAKATYKNETKWLSNFSAPGKENKSLFLVELKIKDQERLEPITQGLGRDRNTCKSSEAAAWDHEEVCPTWTAGLSNAPASFILQTIG